MTSARIRTKLLRDAYESLDVDQRRLFSADASPALQEFVVHPAEDRPEWAPMSLFGEAVVLADRVAGKGDFSTCWGIGLFVAKSEIGPVQSLAMKILHPSMVISLAPSLFTTHFQEAGRVSVRATGERALLASFIDFPEPHPAQCLTIGGWIQGWLGLGPRHAVRVEHTSCRCERALSCDYTVAWDD